MLETFAARVALYEDLEGIERGRWRGSWSDATLVTLEQAGVLPTSPAGHKLRLGSHSKGKLLDS
jgi:hypothetical protein